MKASKINVIIGKKGSGKSYFVKQHVRSFDRVIIFDPSNDFDTDFDSTGFQVFWEIEPFIEDLAETCERPAFRYILRFEHDDEYEMALQAAFECEQLWLVLDEIHLWAGTIKMSPTLERLARLGRHRRVNIVGTTHRITDVNNVFRENIDFLVVFQVSTPATLRYLSELPYISDEQIEQLPTLKQGEYIVLENG